MWTITVFDALSQFAGRFIFVRVEGRWQCWTMNANESISGAAYRWSRKGKFTRVAPIIDTLCFWEPEHCRDSYYKDLVRAVETLRQHLGEYDDRGTGNQIT